MNSPIFEFAVQPLHLNVIYEDNHLLLVNKPASLATMGVASDRTSLLTIAKEYIKHKYNKPGKVYLGIVSRLDFPVTGVVVMARTSKAASRLTKQFKERAVSKHYCAAVAGRVKPKSGECTDWLVRHHRHRKVMIAGADHPNSQQAQLLFHKLGHPTPNTTLLKIELLTGRKHQIRVQLQNMGYPVIGDRKYGSQSKFPDGIALHANRIQFKHPVKNEQVEFNAPLPRSWKTALGIESV